jgi:hypothetical protein
LVVCAANLASERLERSALEIARKRTRAVTAHYTQRSMPF